MGNDYEVGNLLRERRKQLDLTLEDVANYCEVSSSTVSRWETGKIASIKRSQIFSLSQILHLSIEAITCCGDSSNDIPTSLLIKRENLSKLVEKCSETQIDDIIKFTKSFILK